MNKAILMGRLTKDVEARYTQGENPMCVARYTLAVDRRLAKKDAETTADFINVVAFGKAAEFAEKYFKKGMKVLISGRIQTGSYVNHDGIKVYTTDIVAEDQEFTEGKKASGDESAKENTTQNDDASDSDFMTFEDAGTLPF